MSEEFLVKSEVFMKDGRKLHAAKIETLIVENENVLIGISGVEEPTQLKVSIHNFNNEGLKSLQTLKRGDTIIYTHKNEHHYGGDLGKIELFVTIYRGSIY